MRTDGAPSAVEEVVRGVEQLSDEYQIILFKKGDAVNGLNIVGAGRVEILEGDGDSATVDDELGPGDFVKVQIDATDEHDMWGSIVSRL